jgi:alpha-ribazole phosphatase
MRLHLIRHGQTDWNLNRRFQGQSDVPLNETGTDQARKLARRLAQTQLDAIYSSDLTRALQTAEEIARHHKLNVAADSRLREQSFGEWEGLTFAEMRDAAPEALAAWRADPSRNSPPRGETLNQLAARIQSALEEIKTRHKDRRVALVSHGGVLTTLTCLALGVDLSRYWQFSFSSASLSEIAFYDEGAIVNLLNDTSHLGEKNNWDS